MKLDRRALALDVFAVALVAALLVRCGADEKPCRAGHVVTSLPLLDSCEDFGADVATALAIAEKRTGLTLVRDVTVSVDALRFVDDEADARTGGGGTWIVFRSYKHQTSWLLGHELGHAVLQQHGIKASNEGHGPGGVDAEWDSELRAAVRRDALTGARGGWL